MVNATTGALSFATARDFETPGDGATSGTNTYIVKVAATDLSNNVSTQTITVTIANVVDETAPSITSSATATVNENLTAISTLTANETVTWSIAGGVDQSKFLSISTTGALSFG